MYNFYGNSNMRIKCKQIYSFIDLWLCNQLLYKMVDSTKKWDSNILEFINLTQSNAAFAPPRNHVEMDGFSTSCQEYVEILW